MTYHLTSLGVGIATERAPVEAKGKVLLTFCGDLADTVCVGGVFYPIINNRAEIPCEAISGICPVTAHSLTLRRRYPCDPLARLGERGELIAPVPEPWEDQLVRLTSLLGEWNGRLSAAEESLLSLEKKIETPAITFGGTL